MRAKPLWPRRIWLGIALPPGSAPRLRWVQLVLTRRCARSRSCTVHHEGGCVGLWAAAAVRFARGRLAWDSGATWISLHHSMREGRLGKRSRWHGSRYTQSSQQSEFRIHTHGQQSAFLGVLLTPCVEIFFSVWVSSILSIINPLTTNLLTTNIILLHAVAVHWYYGLAPVIWPRRFKPTDNQFLSLPYRRAQSIFGGHIRNYAMERPCGQCFNAP